RLTTRQLPPVAPSPMGEIPHKADRQEASGRKARGRKPSPISPSSTPAPQPAKMGTLTDLGAVNFVTIGEYGGGTFGLEEPGDMQQNGETIYVRGFRGQTPLLTHPAAAPGRTERVRLRKRGRNVIRSATQ